MKQNIHKSVLIGLIASAFCFTAGSAQATASTLLYENVDDAANTTIQFT